MEQTLDGYLAALEALFRNPNDEVARAWWTSEGHAPPAHPDVPLATVHKARLQWLNATDDMLAESPGVPVRPRLRGHQHPRVHDKDQGRRAGEARPAAAERPPTAGRGVITRGRGGGIPGVYAPRSLVGGEACFHRAVDGRSSALVRF